MTATASAPSRGKASARRGSSFSDRQISQSVKDGKAVTFTLADADPVTGWVYGYDDFHWGVVAIDGTTHLVHKTAQCVTIQNDHLLSDLHKVTRQQIEVLVGPFRRYVMENHFGIIQTTDN